MIIGMPRGMIFYKHYPFWSAFFGELGVDFTVSGPTTKAIVNLGLEAAENEFCLPLKVFYGHALDLKDKVDALFIPRVVSVVRGEYTCPKLLGLPDLIRAIDADLPPIISPTIDMRKNNRGYYRTLLDLGMRFTRNPVDVYRAYWKAQRAEADFHAKLRTGMTLIELLDPEFPQTTSTGDIEIGVVGHPYNIYDSYITMNMMKRLIGFGAKIVTAENLPPEVINEAADQLPKKLFWTYEKEIAGAALHWLNDRSVKGIIYVLAFACGPDSFIQAIVEHKGRETSTVPVMSLVIDEHSTEVGMVTRLEAFMDMIKHRDAAEHAQSTTLGLGN